jgi:hypothetical protein
MLLWGQSLYGRTSESRGRCYVATRFFHVYGVPLLPLASYVVVEGSEDSHGFRGRPIPLHRGSITLAWLRAACVLLGAAAAVVAGCRLIDGVVTAELGAAHAGCLPLLAGVALAALGYRILARFTKADEFTSHRLTKLLRMASGTVVARASAATRENKASAGSQVMPSAA